MWNEVKGAQGLLIKMAMNDSVHLVYSDCETPQRAIPLIKWFEGHKDFHNPP